MLRPSIALVLGLACIASCGVKLDGVAGDASRDTPGAPGDAPPVDARPCTGGDARMSSPTGTCYFLFTGPATYANAKTACAAAGGRLAVLRNAQDDAVAQALAGTLDVFFGLTDQVTEGTFVWDDGASLIYSDWYPGEPNDGGGVYPEDCGVINGRRGGAWDDRPCAPDPTAGGGLYAYLCES
jgi:hypothetical protein